MLAIKPLEAENKVAPLPESGAEVGHFSFHLAILTFWGMGRVAVVCSAFLWEF